MKNVLLKIVVLVLFSISAVAMLGLTLYMQYDHFMFTMDKGQLLIMIGNFNLAFILLGLMILQFVGILMLITDMTADAEARRINLINNKNHDQA